MIGIPNFDVTNQTGKQKFVDYIINLMRNEIISFTSSYNDDDNAASTGVLPNGLVPAGTIVMYGGTVLPDGYLWCDGSQQLIASYTSLFIALGVSRYGVDTATQFYLPNLTSRLPRGAATTGGVVTTNNNNTHGHGNNATTTTPTTIANPTQATTNASFTGTASNTGDNTAHTHGVNQGGTNNDGGSTTGVNNTNATRATGNLSTAASGHVHGAANHNHALNGANTNNANVHSHTITASGNITVLNGAITNGAITMGTITTGTVTDNLTYVPAFVEVNYIIKT
jgi:microcystin-dependent protein